MFYSFYVYIKNRFFEKKQVFQKIDNNHSVILNIGYLPEDGSIV
jgi:hypothetical protein